MTNPQSLIFEVEDSGPGIAAEEIHLLFEPFGQTETGRNSQQGSGLGLSISHKFVQLMGGKLTVSSQLGRGSIFTFDIPIGLGATSKIETSQTNGKVIGLAPNQPEYRILVVEDVRINRLLLVKLLKNIGFSVREAENGLEAISLWESWQPHLIWMDMQMPAMDGYEATKHIKAHPKAEATVIIALTASAFDQHKKAVLSAGCDDFISKPFREEVLWAKMQQYLGVRYLYEEHLDSQVDGGAKNTEVDTRSLTSCLSQMPSEWVVQIYQAANECSDGKILQLIKEIPPENVPLAQAITNLTHHFLFNEIIELMEPAITSVV